MWNEGTQVSWTTLWLYIDYTSQDYTITEQTTNGEVSHLQKSLDSITGWSSTNSMKINGRKTKDMNISFKKIKLQLDPITHEGVPLESVDNFKLLGIWISNNMTWKYHVEYIYSIASPRFYYLKQLRRCGVALEDQLMFYKSVIVEIYCAKHFSCRCLTRNINWITS